ncbi:3-phenylpropionate/cinnamic acid dioxygenase subunit beta [Amycolatopsis sp. FDAARGOS 1241]|uniref:aromatic-ring-hydroxylating dioxygenase subunit beta n=1 Tax=Amycolatopsis sp. FDAARGOS 1241 TaxID=2778070 RepID=UPI00194E5EF0|nr:3-phenylpropionate/cinnamic acid dioxygenase subunit beta [Amycolatopsis sp. FDAARGOS 1241]QRP49355.1 3-phenylpropionate/cinnamic acid dioxygenase subunit beta [Amycolatopsis sp. FDAARGOS 1241]
MSGPAPRVALEVRLTVHDFLVDEAALLDHGRFEEWLALFTDDVEYTAPIRVTRKTGNPGVVEDIGWFDDNRASLGLRVRRLATDVAWAEDPPSMTRRFVTNIRIVPAEDGYVVTSNLMLFRSRGDGGTYDLVVGERTDLLREVDGDLKISRRRILLDQASLGTKNLGVFL